MSTPTSLANWPGGSPHSASKTDGLEPSGLAYAPAGGHSYLYMASDNGKIARYSDGWQSQSYGDDDAHDYESAVEVTNELMIGIEGASESRAPFTNPQIVRFDPGQTSSNKPLGDFTGSSWSLGGMTLASGGGMEALAFIPSADSPSSWGTPSYYGGFFLVATQAAPGNIYVYDLVQGLGVPHTVDAPLAQFTDDLLNYKISDLFYSQESGLLFVLYDDVCPNNASTCTDAYNGSKYIGALQILKLDKSSGTFVNQAAVKTPYVGCEAVVYTNGNNLLIGLDQNPDQFTVNGLSHNYVLEYNDFLS